MTEEKLCGGKTFKEVMDEVNFHIHDKHKIEQLEKENEELKKEISVLLSCADCSENKGGYICEKEYNDKCLAQKIEHIKELNEENAKLKKQNEELVKLSQNRGIFIDWCCSKHPKIIIQYLEE